MYTTNDFCGSCGQLAINCQDTHRLPAPPLLMSERLVNGTVISHIPEVEEIDCICDTEDCGGSECLCDCGCGYVDAHPIGCTPEGGCVETCRASS